MTASCWSNAHEPRLKVAPGDRVTIEMLDSSGGQVHRGMTAAAFAEIDFLRIHALTGPIAVEGAGPGDALVVTIESFAHKGWAWTSLQPGMGLLRDEISCHYLFHWKLEDSQTRSMPGVTLDLAPFCGIIGLQRAEPGEFPTRQPGVFGGNMDVRHLTGGAVLHLPVAVPGGQLMAGDCHAAQGDGEVCVNGMEAPMSVTLKLDLLKGRAPPAPCAVVPGTLVPRRYAAKPFHAFIESGPDVLDCARGAVRRAIEYLMRRLDLPQEQAYILCSVVLDLKLSQVVNGGVMTVTGYLPEAIFDEV